MSRISFSEIRDRLARRGFSAKEHADWLDSARTPEGSLRVALAEGDGQIEVFAFNEHGLMLWSLKLNAWLPAAVFEAAFSAALALAPQARRVRRIARCSA